MVLSSLLSGALENAFLNGRLFVTAHGRIGLGPPSVRVGDEIYIFYKGRVLFIVSKMEEMERSDGEVHGTLVGDCFLDRFMFREMAKVSERSERTIVLS